MAGSTVGKQGTVPRLKQLVGKQNHVPLKWLLHGMRPLCQPFSPTTSLRIFTTQMNLACFIKPYPTRLCIWSLKNVWVGGTAKQGLLAWLPQMLRVRSCQCLSLANLQDQGILLALENSPADKDRKKKSWMDCILFEEWITELNRKFLGEGGKVALIVDNCSAYPHVEGLKAIQLVFLPPNTMWKIQAMDQGVIRLLKAHYRALTVQLFIHAIDNNQNKHRISNEYA